MRVWRVAGLGWVEKDAVLGAAEMGQKGGVCFCVGMYVLYIGSETLDLGRWGVHSVDV